MSPKLLSPVEARDRGSAEMSKLASFAGKRLVFVSNRRSRNLLMCDLLGDWLVGEHGLKSFEYFEEPEARALSKEQVETLSSEFDIAVGAYAGCGSCTSAVTRSILALTKAGLPSLLIHSEVFTHEIHRLTQFAGVAELPMQIFDRDWEFLPEQEFRHTFNGKLDGIAAKLLAAGFQLGSEDVSEPNKLRDIGSVAADDIDGLYELMMDNGWGDGMPVIPPTEARVRAMIDAVGLDPEFSFGEVPPQLGDATVATLAANAVLAGCRPEYFPVVLAMVEAALDPAYNLDATTVTTNPASPVVMINGPIRHAIGVNSDVGALGPGFRANATIGRTLRLVLQTLGGARPGPICKSMLSSPERYSFCFGENEEKSPWVPLHVERGFAPGASTVTMAGSDSLLFTVAGIYFDKGDSLAKGIGAFLTQVGLSPRDGNAHLTVIIPPPIANRLNEQGVSRNEIRQKIFEAQRVPNNSNEMFQVWNSHPGMPNMRRDDGFITICEDVEDLLIVVAGGEFPSYVGIMPSYYQHKPVTKEIIHTVSR